MYTRFVCIVIKKSVSTFSMTIYSNVYTVELHLSGRWLSGPPIIRTGLVLPVNLSRILHN